MADSRARPEREQEIRAFEELTRGPARLTISAASWQLGISQRTGTDYATTITKRTGLTLHQHWLKAYAELRKTMTVGEASAQIGMSKQNGYLWDHKLRAAEQTPDQAEADHRSVHHDQPNAEHGHHGPPDTGGTMTETTRETIDRLKPTFAQLVAEHDPRNHGWKRQGDDTITIKIYGASDDLIEVEGCDGADEFLGHRRGPVMWHGELFDGNNMMRIHAIYDGCWSFSVGQCDEELPLPDWPIRISQHNIHHYSALLEIDAPAGTKLVNVWPVRNDS